MGVIQESLSRLFPRIGEYKWAVRAVIGIETVVFLWAAVFRPILDTAGRYEFVKADWPAIEAGAIAAVHAVGNFAASPITATAVFIVGFGFLYLEKRFGSRTITIEPLTSRPDVDDVSDDIPASADGTFPLVHTIDTARIVRGNDEGEDDCFFMAGDKPSETFAILARFTNGDLAPHIVTARLTYFRKGPTIFERGGILRIIHNPVWLANNQGNQIPFGRRETCCLILATETLDAKQWYSLEDHRRSSSFGLRIEFGALESVETFVQIDLNVDGQWTKSLELNVDFKTFSLASKTGKAPILDPWKPGRKS